PPGAGAPHEVADVVLVGGDLWTMDPQHPRAEAAAWRGDRILAVGDAAAVRALAGPSTRVIDLHGRSATPGLVDAHCHLYGLGSDLENVSVRGLTSEAATVAAMAAAAKTRPASQWLIGRGWDQNRWPGQQVPTRTAADAYRKLAAAHQLPLRVRAYMGLPEHLERLATPPGPATGRFEMRGVKIYADGALGSRGARLYEPYSDDPNNRGLWRTEPAALARAVDA